ncbi:MAG: hypothetical protein ACTSYS_07770 [Promethearchaeota archaeon]
MLKLDFIIFTILFLVALTSIIITKWLENEALIKTGGLKISFLALITFLVLIALIILIDDTNEYESLILARFNTNSTIISAPSKNYYTPYTKAIIFIFLLLLHVNAIVSGLAITSLATAFLIIYYKISVEINKKKNPKNHVMNKKQLILIASSAPLIYNVITQSFDILVFLLIFYIFIYLFLKRYMFISGIVLGVIGLMRYEFFFYMLGWIILLTKEKRKNRKEKTHFFIGIIISSFPIILLTIFGDISNFIFIFSDVYVHPEAITDINFSFLMIFINNVFIQYLNAIIFITLYFFLLKFMGGTQNLKTIANPLLLLFIIHFSSDLGFLIIIMPLIILLSSDYKKISRIMDALNIIFMIELILTNFSRNQSEAFLSVNTLFFLAIIVYTFMKNVFLLRLWLRYLEPWKHTALISTMNKNTKKEKSP